MITMYRMSEYGHDCLPVGDINHNTYEHGWNTHTHICTRTTLNSSLLLSQQNCSTQSTIIFIIPVIHTSIVIKEQRNTISSVSIRCHHQHGRLILNDDITCHKMQHNLTLSFSVSSRAGDTLTVSRKNSTMDA